MAPKIWWREGDIKLTLKDSFRRIQSSDTIKQGTDIVVRAKVTSGLPTGKFRLQLSMEDNPGGGVPWSSSRQLFSGEFWGMGMIPMWFLMGDNMVSWTGTSYAFYNPGIIPFYKGVIPMVNQVGYRRRFRLRLWKKESGTWKQKDEWVFYFHASDVTITADKTVISTGDVVNFTGTAPPNSAVKLVDVNTYIGGQNVTLGLATADSGGKWYYSGPMRQHGVPGDITLNVQARVGTIESTMVVIKITIASVIGGLIPPIIPPGTATALKWIAGIAGVTVFGAFAYGLSKGGR